MTRWVAFLAAAAVAVATMVAVARAPRLRCQSLDQDRCIAAASAIMAQARSGPSIATIGLFGYRGRCLPVGFCPLGADPIPPPLNALAGVEYADGTKVALFIDDLDPGRMPVVGRIEPVEVILRLTLPEP